MCSGRHDEYLLGRAKTGGLGQVTTKKITKKIGITRTRPDGGVIMNKKSPRGIYPAVVLSTLGVQNKLRPRKIQTEVV